MYCELKQVIALSPDLSTRNALIHTYDGSLVEIPVEEISQTYYPALKTIHHTMLSLRDANN